MGPWYFHTLHHLDIGGTGRGRGGQGAGGQGAGGRGQGQGCRGQGRRSTEDGMRDHQGGRRQNYFAVMDACTGGSEQEGRGRKSKGTGS